MFDGRYCLSLCAYIYTASKYRCLESICVFISHLILTHRGNPVLCNTKTEKNLLVCAQPSFLGFDAALGQNPWKETFQIFLANHIIRPVPDLARTQGDKPKKTVSDGTYRSL